MFGLDYRSLALLRMGIAGVVLADLYFTSFDLRAFFTDEGVLPRGMMRYTLGAVDTLCLHALRGEAWFQYAMFAVEAVLALLMLVGYRTRAMTIACWVMYCSRQARNPLIVFGADIILRVMFFWAI